eukprot:gene1979-3574_t
MLAFLCPPNACTDDATFADMTGYPCAGWADTTGFRCSEADEMLGFTAQEKAALLAACPQGCGLCATTTPSLHS